MSFSRESVLQTFDSVFRGVLSTKGELHSYRNQFADAFLAHLKSIEPKSRDEVCEKIITELESEQWLTKIQSIWDELHTHLEEHGWVVFPNVLSDEECDYFSCELAHTVKEMYHGLYDPNVPDTTSNRIGAKRGGMEQHYGAGLTTVMQKLRSHPNIRNLYALVWGLEPIARTSIDIGPHLLSSFDGFNHSPAHEKLRKTLARNRCRSDGDDANEIKYWWHLDQTTKNDTCYQGFVTMEEIGPKDANVCFIDGSHKFHTEFIAEFKNKVGKDNWLLLDDNGVEWFKDKNCNPVNVVMPRGSFVVWNSKLVHQGSFPMATREVPRDRNVAYIAMAPVAMCSKANLKKRQEIFWNGDSTSHWPHVHVKAFPFSPRIYGAPTKFHTDKMNEYRERKKNKQGPLNVDTLTETQRRLMGILDYPK